MCNHDKKEGRVHEYLNTSKENNSKKRALESGSSNQSRNKQVKYDDSSDYNGEDIIGKLYDFPISVMKTMSETLFSQVLSQKYSKKAKFIDCGGMGAVFQLEGEPQKAYKVIYKDSENRAKEVNVVEKLKHTHIVNVFGTITTTHGELQYIIIEMEYYKHGNVAKGDFTKRMLWLILHQIALVLEYIDEHEYMHRDIKPENIFVESIDKIGDDIKVVLGDFGLARQHGTITTHNSGGTFNYMAPESLNGAPTILSDIFSLGKTLQELAERNGNPCVYLEYLTNRMIQFIPTNRPSIKELVERSQSFLDITK